MTLFKYKSFVRNIVLTDKTLKSIDLLRHSVDEYLNIVNKVLILTFRLLRFRPDLLMNFKKVYFPLFS